MMVFKMQGKKICDGKEVDSLEEIRFQRTFKKR